MGLRLAEIARWWLALGLMTWRTQRRSAQNAQLGVLLFLAGAGIGAYHPQGAALARQAGRGSGLAMSAFTVGGNIGFGLALAALVVLFEGRLRETAVTRVFGALIGCAIGLGIAHLITSGLFWADNGGAIGTNWWDGNDPNGAWNKHPAFRITAPGIVPPGASVAATARHPDHLDVFWVDSDGAIETNWWDGHDSSGAWDQHSTVRVTNRNAVTPATGVAAVARYPDQYIDPTQSLSIRVREMDIGSSTATVDR